MCYNMGVLDYIKDKVKNIFNFNKSNADFLQYNHMNVCKSSCRDCFFKNLKIYENGEELLVRAHLWCDSLRLYYSNDGLMFYSEFHDETQVVFIK